MNYTETLKQAFEEAVNAVLPKNVIPESVKVKDKTLQIENDTYPLKKFYLFGSGKASIEMAKAIEGILEDYVISGTVVCNYTEPLKKVKVLEGSHPIPDQKSIKAGETLLKEISSLKENDLFIYLLSGGSSALIEKPIPPITLEDLQKTNSLLLKSGASIDEVNTVRKHISLIKGGRLGQSTKATGIVLVISDVVGDDLETIGSAPLYYDRTTYKDAYLVLEKYNLLDKIPTSVKQVIEKGLNKEIEDTPKKPPKHIKHNIVANNLKALKGAKGFLEKKNIPAHIITSQIEGEAKEVAKVITGIGKDIRKKNSFFSPPVALLFGGETTVAVKGNGKGGRNQELVLSAINQLKDTCGIHILSGGTDGIDGITDAAGAFGSCDTYKKAKELNLDIEKFLENNDSYSFFKTVGGLIKTGYTGTNVMDVIILFVEG